MVGEVVSFTPINDVHARINASPAVAAEIRDHFSYLMPNARFHPLVKKGHWDGVVHLFKKGMLYIGLREALESFCTGRGYTLEYPECAAPPSPSFTDDLIEDYLDELNIPDKFEIRDYQFATFNEGIANERSIFLSPTSSGKSLMIYLLARWHGVKTLIIVPTVSLVHQMAGDFVDYGFPKDQIHTIAGGERWSDRPIVISTWQSIVALMDTPEWFEQFGMVIGDEVHRFAAKSLVSIMEALTDCPVRYGFTGSLDDSKCNKMVLQGLFGPVHEVTTTRKLIDDGYVSDIDVNVLLLKHPEPVRKHHFKYMEEVEFLIGCPARNQFIVDLALNLDGNTLLLYHRVEQHGKILAEMFKAATDRPVYYIHGGVDGEERDDVRHEIEDHNNAIIVASYGTFSTGINIKRLNNVVLTASFKSRVLNLQSLGRGLRLSEHKDKFHLWDLTDDMSWKKRKNYTLLHGERRIEIYAEQDFEYRMERIDLNY